MSWTAFWIIGIGICPGGVAVMAWLALRPKFDAIETHETNVRIIAALICTGAFLLLVALLGVGLVAKTYIENGLPSFLVACPSAGVMFFPLVYALVAFIRLPGTLTKANEADEAGPAELQDQVQEAAGILGLRVTPDVRLSACQRHYHGPLLFGRWGCRPVLVLPQDFNAITSSAAKGDPGTTESLMRFVLLHELAHAAHGDYQFMSWVEAFLPGLKWWALVVVGAAGGYSLFVGLAKAMMAVSCLLWLSLIFGLLLWLTCRSIQQHRELLADTRAAGLVHPAELSALLAGDDRVASPLAALFVLLNVRHWLFEPRERPRATWLFRVAGMLRSGLSRLRAIVMKTRLAKGFGLARRLGGTHPLFEDRLRSLRTADLLGEVKASVSYGAAVLAFVSVGLAFVVTMLILVLPEALFGWPASTLAVTMVWILADLGLAVLMCLPLRNAATAMLPLRVQIRGWLAKPLVGGLVMVFVVAMSAIPLAFIDFGTYVQWAWFAAGLGMLTVVAVMALALLLDLLIWAGQYMQSITFAGGAEPWQLLAFAAFALGPMVVLGCIVFDCSGRWELGTEGVAWRLVAFGWALPLPMAVGLLFVRRCLRTPSDVYMVRRQLVAHTAALAAVLSIVFALAALPLVRLAFAFHDALQPLSTGARSLAASGSALGPILLLSAVFIVSKCQPPALSLLAEFFVLCRELGLRPPAELMKRARAAVERCRTTSGGFGFRPGALPDLESTRHALSVLAFAGEPTTPATTATQWVLTHQTPMHGFARRVGHPPSLGATVAAVGSLDAAGSLWPDAEQGLLSQWVAKCQKAPGGFGDGHGGTGCSLGLTAGAAECLRQIRGLGLIDREAATSFALAQWDRSRKGMNEAYWAVSTLRVLGKLRGNVHQRFRLWCLAAKPWALRLNPAKHAGTLRMFVELAGCVLDRDELEGTRALLAAHVEAAFVKLERRWH